MTQPGTRSGASTPINPKVPAAAGGGGVGAAIGLVLIWLLERGGEDLPTTVEGAILVIAAALLSFLGGYFKAGPR